MAFAIVSALQNMNTQEKSEQAARFIEELSETLMLLPDYERAYQALGQTFRRVLDANTEHRAIQFAGIFAQTDHLLTEFGTDAAFRHEVNEMRVRLQRFWERQEVHELETYFGLDFRTVCRFVTMIYGIEIPAELQQKWVVAAPIAAETKGQICKSAKEFSPRPQSITAEKREEVRFVVESWDQKYIYGRADTLESSNWRVSYIHGFFQYPYDWSYLREILYKGAQLNLVRPRMDEDTNVIFPELIILNPDNLVNISSIAACFESYGITPYTYLLNKIRPSEDTEATLIGNFASQLLDEEMRGVADSYAESVKRFFAQYALSLLTTDILSHFHDECQRQRVNIHRAFMELESENVVKNFHRESVMLEPSFICPMLGLQGRMDLLQLDFSFLIEQKSGKSAFPPPVHSTEKPRPQVKHYVQMLLYMALVRYNFPQHYATNRHHLSAFLLYSKYQDSLCGLGFAPELIFQAIKVRNQITRLEELCVQDGFHQLDSLTPALMNERGIADKLWVQWQSPQIEQILRPIHIASPLERAYYFRFLTFVGLEQQLSKIGNGRNLDGGFASVWLTPLSAKRQAGNIYDNLRLLEPCANHIGEVSGVVLSFNEDGCNDMANFRTGDIVMLYPYENGGIPDARHSVILRCSVMKIENDRLHLQIRTPQSSNIFFRTYADGLWAIEHDFMDSSYSSRYRGLHAFLSAPQERRNLVLLQRQPAVDTPLQLQGDYGTFNDLALRVKRAHDFFLIIGPPGTGKTSYGMLTTLKEQLLEPNTSVLLVAYTNRAVDEMCGKLLEEGIPYLRLGHELSTVPEIRSHLLVNRIKSCRTLEEVRSLVLSTRVFAGTTTSFAAHSSVLRLKPFALAIVDEASQILEPDLMGLLSTTLADGTPAVRKFVFIGDHKQLPAVVQQSTEDSHVSNPLLRSIGLTDCRLSLFERLLQKYRHDPDLVYLLTRQGRMHPDVAQYANQTFYQNRLDVVPLPHQQASHTLDTSVPPTDRFLSSLSIDILNHRFAFVSVPCPPVTQSKSDKVNLSEAEIIAQLAYQIYIRSKSTFSQHHTLGIIVPYRNQIAAIRHLLTIHFPEASLLHDITIDTVERYQGSQRDCIIYGFTIQRPYQLDFLTDNTFLEEGHLIDRKLNVAMTRARHQLLLVGNSQLLSQNTVFASLMEFAKQHQSYFSGDTFFPHG